MLFADGARGADYASLRPTLRALRTSDEGSLARRVRRRPRPPAGSRAPSTVHWSPGQRRLPPKRGREREGGSKNEKGDGAGDRASTQHLLASRLSSLPATSRTGPVGKRSGVAERGPATRFGGTVTHSAPESPGVLPSRGHAGRSERSERSRQPSLLSDTLLAHHSPLGCCCSLQFLSPWSCWPICRPSRGTFTRWPRTLRNGTKCSRYFCPAQYDDVARGG